MVKYGGLARTATFFTEAWAEIQVQSIGVFRPGSVLGFKISRDLLSVSLNASSAVANPLTVSFTSFIAKEKKENITTIYNLLIKYTNHKDTKSTKDHGKELCVLCAFVV